MTAGSRQQPTVKSAKSTRNKVLVYLILTFGISSVFYYHMLSTGSVGDVGVVWMWSPGIAAILTQLLFRGSLCDFGWRPGKPRYLPLGFVVPLLYASVIYVTVWLTGLGGLATRPIVIGGFAFPLLVSLAASAEGRRASPGERR